MKIDGAVCWVSGAASGIGLEISKELVAAGGRVVMVDIAPIADGEATALALAARGRGEAAYVRADMTSVSELERALKQPQALFGSVATIVCGNAGIAAQDDDLPMATMMIDLNTRSILAGTQIAAELMQKAGKQGVVVNTASFAGLTPMKVSPMYAASKWAVVGYTLSQRLNKSMGVRVNCVCPAVVDTPMGVSLKEAAVLTNDKGLLASADRLIEPSDVAAAFLKIIQDDALANQVCVVTVDKIFMHDPKFQRVFSQLVDPAVPHFIPPKTTSNL